MTANPFYEGGEDWSQFVEHPRFGRGPRYTSGELPWGSDHTTRLGGAAIPGTAVEADSSRQVPSPVPALYYFDQKRVCRDCQRNFLFFADEQKHWYEVLGFTLNSNCVRCPECRKRYRLAERSIAAAHRRYDQLRLASPRLPRENLEMAECCLRLMESGAFATMRIDRVRMLLNRVTEAGDSGFAERCAELRARLRTIELARRA